MDGDVVANFASSSKTSASDGKTNRKMFWVRQIFAKREQLGEFHTLVQEMRTSDRESFFKQVIFSLSDLFRDPSLKQYLEICIFLQPDKHLLKFMRNKFIL